MITAFPESPSLYVHIPFCLSRCDYCAFTSGLYDAALANRYLQALEVELQNYGGVFQDAKPATIFIGGGTPNCLNPDQLNTLLSFLPATTGEFTCELNPDSTTPEKLLLLQQYGCNRVSFGVQTFSPAGLQMLGRRHSWDRAIHAVELAKAVGFDSINIDLINGWPGQNENSIDQDITRVHDLGIQHVSYYSLMLEHDAPGRARFSALLDTEEVEEEKGRRYWDIIEGTLEKYNFIHYETSNFALPEYQCQHNIAIWKGGEYLGVGIGACSHLEGERWGNITDINTYIQHSADRQAIQAYREVLLGEAKARECAVFWLRLFAGIDVREFKSRSGYDFCELYHRELAKLLDQGALEWVEHHTIRVTKEFHPLLDIILTDLV